MKVLVLGGSVFVGRSIAKQFINNGDDVYVLNRGNHEIIDGAKLIKVDRNDLSAMMEALSSYKFDIVVDGSCYTLSQSEIAYEALKDKVNRFVHISTSAVYLHSEILPYREDFERGANRYWGKYSKNKYEIEQFLFSKHQSDYFPVTLLRPFYLYGPENNILREKYVFSRLLHDRPILIPGMGLPVVQFGHVDDLAECISLVIQKDVTIGKGYNVSGTEYLSLKGWVELCAKAIGVEPKIELVDTASTGYKYFEWFPFRDINLFGDVSAIERDTGFVPKYDLLSGLKHTAEEIGVRELKNSLLITEAEKDILSTLGLS